MAQLHLLLLERALDQFPAFTCRLPTLDNSSSRRLSTLFGPPGIPGTHAMHLSTCRQNTHIKKKRKGGTQAVPRSVPLKGNSGLWSKWHLHPPILPPWCLVKNRAGAGHKPLNHQNLEQTFFLHKQLTQVFFYNDTDMTNRFLQCELLEFSYLLNE